LVAFGQYLSYHSGDLPLPEKGYPVYMNRIKELRKARNLTQEQLAELLGTTDATIQRLESGKRQLTERWAAQISTVLGVDVTEVFGAILPVTNAGLPVVGDVQAGVWREIDVVDEPKHSPLPIGPDPRYQAATQFALLVLGESMNKVFAAGTFIVCVPWEQLGRQPRENDIVVVERQRDGMVETTVKRIEIQNRKLVLMPESTDPRFQSPIELDGSLEHDRIVVTALVVGKYQQL
jgi:transcriptional regulator with XRE-family HTH domain